MKWRAGGPVERGDIIARQTAHHREEATT